MRNKTNADLLLALDQQRFKIALVRVRMAFRWPRWNGVPMAAFEWRSDGRVGMAFRWPRWNGVPMVKAECY